MRTIRIILTFAMLAAVPLPVFSAAPLAPDQPATGPGGADYPHAAFVATRIGQNEHEVWIFEPASPTPTKPAPLVVFCHGWGAMTPNIYGAWIEHLVRRGNIVVFPRYQRDLATPSIFFTNNTVAAVKNAINTLRTGDHVQPDPDRVVVAGHSVGGILAPNLAARADGRFIPKPAGVFSIQPGISAKPETWWGVPLEDLRRIGPDTLLVTCAGDRDGTTGDSDARRIYKAATNVPAARKSYLLYRTDDHGTPRLIADHRSPAALKAIVDDKATVGPQQKIHPDAMKGFGKALFDRIGSESIDTLDTHGYWAVLDRLIDASGADDPRLRAAALGQTPASRSLGEWSDGSPVTPPQRLTP